MPTKNAAAMLAEISVTFQCDLLDGCAVGVVALRGFVGVVIPIQV
jgi:hypothetical protein